MWKWKNAKSARSRERGEGGWHWRHDIGRAGNREYEETEERGAGGRSEEKERREASEEIERSEECRVPYTSFDQISGCVVIAFLFGARSFEQACCLRLSSCAYRPTRHTHSRLRMYMLYHIYPFCHGKPFRDRATLRPNVFVECKGTVMYFAWCSAVQAGLIPALGLPTSPPTDTCHQGSVRFRWWTKIERVVPDFA